MRSKNGASRVRTKSRTRAALGVVAVISAAAVVGSTLAIAFADIPDGSTFNACADKTTGGLRVIDKSKKGKCKPTETALSWTKKGSKGATGLAGPTGSLFSQTTSGAAPASLNAPPGLSFVGGVAIPILTGQTVEIDASVVLGSGPGTTDLSLWACYSNLAGDTGFHTVGSGETNMTLVTGEQRSFPLNGDITGLATGTYAVGLCGSGTGVTANGNFYVTASRF